MIRASLRLFVATALLAWGPAAFAQDVSSPGGGGGAPSGAAGGKLSGTYPNPGLGAACADLSNAAGTCSSNALSALATQAANTAVANVTGSTAAPTAAAMPSCTDTGGNHLNYTSGTGFSCGTSSAVTLISTQTATNSASLSWTSLGSYKHYEIKCTDLIPETDATYFLLQFGEGGTPTWKTTNYVWVSVNSSSSQNPVSTGDSSAIENITSGILVGAQVTNTSNHTISTNIEIGDPGSAKYKVAKFHSGNFSVFHNGYDDTNGSGQYEGDTNAITAFRLIAGSGNITSGQCSLYGLSS